MWRQATSPHLDGWNDLSVVLEKRNLKVPYQSNAQMSGAQPIIFIPASTHLRKKWKFIGHFTCLEGKTMEQGDCEATPWLQGGCYEPQQFPLWHHNGNLWKGSASNKVKFSRNFLVISRLQTGNCEEMLVKWILQTVGPLSDWTLNRKMLLISIL